MDRQAGNAAPEHSHDLLEGLFRQGGLGHQTAGLADRHLLRLLRGLQNDGLSQCPAGGADDLGMGPLAGDVYGNTLRRRFLNDGMDAVHEGTGGVHGADAALFACFEKGRRRAVGPDDQGVPGVEPLQVLHGQDALVRELPDHGLVVDQLPPGVDPAPRLGFLPRQVHRPAHTEAEPGVLRHDDLHIFRLSRRGTRSSVS